MKQSIILAAFIASTTATQTIASCNDLPTASANTVFQSAKVYATSGRQTLDEHGIVLFDYGATYNGLGKWANPFFNARYAHALYRDWLNSDCLDTDLKDSFLRHAEWFIDTREMRDGMSLWTYPFFNDHFGVEAGWYSGIGQSQIAGILLRAYSMTGDQRYRDIGQEALEVYFRPMSIGGVITTEGNDLWIQEVPDPKGAPFNILNGHITGALVLEDVRALSGESERISNVIAKSIETVRNNIQKFDAGFTSFYSMHLESDSYAQISDRIGYHALHISQLMMLYELDGDPLFLDWAMRFQAYDDINDTRTAKGSTDPDGHGPYEAAGWYGIRYWSHSQFPTWYEISMGSRTRLDGIYLEGLTDTSMGRDMIISTYLDGAKQENANITGNESRLSMTVELGPRIFV